MADESYNRRRSRPTREPYLPPNRRNISNQLSDLSLDVKAPSNGINFDAYEDIPVETTGDNVPLPVNSFSDIQLGMDLERNIKHIGYTKPTPVQKHAIPVVLAGRDLMACAQTGSGKTAAFCLPIIYGVLNCKDGFFEPRESEYGRIGSPLALILAPTRELAGQIHDEANKFAFRTRLKVVVVYGGVPIFHQMRNLERGVDILVATPGRLVDLIDRGKVSLQKVKYLALDEADRMLDMGFEPQIRKIVEQNDMPKAKQVMLFSATFPSEIQRMASDFLSNYVFLTVGRVGSSTDLITQKVVDVSSLNKRDHLIDILRGEMRNASHAMKPLTLVFVETKREADSLENYLSRNGLPATSIHGDRTQWEREHALKSFKKGMTPIMVATDVAARGLDIPNVSHVINFDLPRNIDSYVHRIGRTGRAGKSGLATAFFDSTNHPIAKQLVNLMKEAKQEIPDWLNQFADDGSSFGEGKYEYSDYRNQNWGAVEQNYVNNINNANHNWGVVEENYVNGNNANHNWGVVEENYVNNNNANHNWGVVEESFVGQSYQDVAGSNLGLGFGTEQVVATGWE